MDNRLKLGANSKHEKCDICLKVTGCADDGFAKKRNTETPDAECMFQMRQKR